MSPAWAARPATRIIGITGPIGCGKSTVSGWLRELGLATIDADAVARDVVEPGEPALAAVVEGFGPAILQPDGALDRAALGRIVFADAAALERLERIVHPAVRPRILAAIEAARVARASGVAVEAIRLVEGGLAELCDEVWRVRCSPEAQRARLTGRGMTADEAERRIAAQAGLETRVAAVATRVIDTDGTLAEARARVSTAWTAASAASG